MMDIQAERLWMNIEELSRIGRQDDGSITRLPFTEEDMKAKEWLSAKMKEAGLSVREDAVGNIIGERTGTRPELPCIICGSHYDTVKRGGRFDGVLGILAGLEALRTMEEHKIQNERTILLIGFKDEEGNRFGYGMIGSKSICGITDLKGLQSEDADGVTLESAMLECGYRPELIPTCRISPIQLFLELHIEQGRVLEQYQKSIGIVEGIAGLVRYTIRIKGESGHAGATPMLGRKDPVPVMSRFIQKVTELAMERENCVATVGKIQTLPGACNVICEEVLFSLDLRSVSEEDIEAIIVAMNLYNEQLCREYGVEIEMQEDQRLPVCLCNKAYQSELESICEEEGISWMHMVSGAGHDCMNFREVCDTAMIFVPSKSGMSHRKEEFTSYEECSKGALVLYKMLLKASEADTSI